MAHEKHFLLYASLPLDSVDELWSSAKEGDHDDDGFIFAYIKTVFCFGPAEYCVFILCITSFVCVCVSVFVCVCVCVCLHSQWYPLWVLLHQWCVYLYVCLCLCSICVCCAVDWLGV